MAKTETKGISNHLMYCLHCVSHVDHALTNIRLRILVQGWECTWVGVLLQCPFSECVLDIHKAYHKRVMPTVTEVRLKQFSCISCFLCMVRDQLQWHVHACMLHMLNMVQTCSCDENKLHVGCFLIISMCISLWDVSVSCIRQGLPSCVGGCQIGRESVSVMSCSVGHQACNSLHANRDTIVVVMLWKS